MSRDINCPAKFVETNFGSQTWGHVTTSYDPKSRDVKFCEVVLHGVSFRSAQSAFSLVFVSIDRSCFFSLLTRHFIDLSASSRDMLVAARLAERGDTAGARHTVFKHVPPNHGLSPKKPDIRGEVSDINPPVPLTMRLSLRMFVHIRLPFF